MEEGKEMKDSAETDISRVPLTRTPSNHYREDESEEDRFNNSLQELMNLRSQLHHAADYCENAFFKAERKDIVVEGTKSYIREAIVTVVDHLGTVSSKLEQELLANVVLQTQQRIDCLKQWLSIKGCQVTSPGVRLAKATPVIEGQSILSKPTHTLLNCRSQLHMLGGVYQRKKHTQANNFLSFLRVGKRKT